MKIEPVRYSRLIMQLMMPTPMKALRHARNASPSSERRTPGTAAMARYLFVLEGEGNPLAMFLYIVHLSCVNLNCIKNGTRSVQFRLPASFHAEPPRNPGRARVY